MILRILTIFTLFLATFPLLAQVNTVERVEDRNIRSVQINKRPSAGNGFNTTISNLLRSDTVRNNLALPYQVVKLKKDSIALYFDHIGDELQSYIYTIVHCNSDWQPSELQDNEYIDGFTEERITDITNSVNTLVDYTSYRLVIPNPNMAYTRSGNYILIVMDEDNDREIVLVRRFMVCEDAWSVFPKMARVVNASKLFTHQEIDFDVRYEGYNLNNPTNEVKAFVYQNMREDRKLGPIAPRPYITTGKTLSFDYQDSIVFPAGRDWRFFDTRNLDYRGPGVRSQERGNNTWNVILKPEQDRFESRGYALINDIDGYYFTQNFTNGQSVEQSEYTNVQFILQRNAPFEDLEVYVYGELTDWKIKPEFLMEYNEPSHTYYCTSLLKQGYYNYEFVVVDPKTSQPTDEYDLEGNWHETGNNYTILVYYRPFGGNYDRLMGMGKTNSRIE